MLHVYSDLIEVSMPSCVLGVLHRNQPLRSLMVNFLISGLFICIYGLEVNRSFDI